MSYSVRCLSPEEWKLDSESAHSLSFGEIRSKELERITFALLALKEDIPIGYVQCIEMDAESIYWQFGGIFPEAKKKVEAVAAYLAGIDWCLSRYKRITSRIENVNIPMLKLAMKMGFLVVGTRVANGKIYLEVLKEK